MKTRMKRRTKLAGVLFTAVLTMAWRRPLRTGTRCG